MKAMPGSSLIVGSDHLQAAAVIIADSQAGTYPDIWKHLLAFCDLLGPAVKIKCYLLFGDLRPVTAEGLVDV